MDDNLSLQSFHHVSAVSAVSPTASSTPQPQSSGSNTPHSVPRLGDFTQLRAAIQTSSSSSSSYSTTAQETASHRTPQEPPQNPQKKPSQKTQQKTLQTTPKKPHQAPYQEPPSQGTQRKTKKKPQAKAYETRDKAPQETRKNKQEERSPADTEGTARMMLGGFIEFLSQMVEDEDMGAARLAAHRAAHKGDARNDQRPIGAAASKPANVADPATAAKSVVIVEPSSSPSAEDEPNKEPSSETDADANSLTTRATTPPNVGDHDQPPAASLAKREAHRQDGNLGDGNQGNLKGGDDQQHNLHGGGNKGETNAATRGASNSSGSLPSGGDVPLRRRQSPERAPAMPVQLFSYQHAKWGPRMPVFGTRRSLEQKHESLAMGLIPLRGHDGLLAAQMPEAAAHGVHVFVDMSNICISFHNAVRARHRVPDAARLVPLPVLNLPFLTELLVRGRDARVLNVGCSVRPGSVEPHYVQELRDLDYRVDLRERKLADDANPSYYDYCSPSSPSSSSDEHQATGSGSSSWRRNNHQNKKNHYNNRRHNRQQPHSSACAAPAPPTTTTTTTNPARYVEDLVDETLQTRIGESVMEYFDRRGTLVLATGDAKPARYSDGFLAYARRALRMGWCVEVVAWRASLSAAWRDPAWAAQWGDRLRVIELDDFLDELTV